MTSSLYFCNSSVKLDPALKLFRLIAGKVHQICKFEDHVTRNDVMIMSLPKTMKKWGRPRNQSNYRSFERS